MYSPKIRDELIPVLYRAAKERAMPMTCLVDQLLYQALCREPLSLETLAHFQCYRSGRPADGSFVSDEKVVAEGIAELLRYAEMPAFRTADEIDAWYVRSQEGVRRAARLRATACGENPLRLHRHVEMMDRLRAMREESCGLLSETPHVAD